MDLLHELHPQAVRIAGLLRARGEKVAVADGATGGLIAATLLTVPGALDFFVGGGVVYSMRARDVLFALPRYAYKGMRGASEEYALLQVHAIRDNFHAQWGLAESGSVGGSNHPSGAPAGRSVAAVHVHRHATMGAWVLINETWYNERVSAAATISPSRRVAAGRPCGTLPAALRA